MENLVGLGSIDKNTKGLAYLEKNAFPGMQFVGKMIGKAKNLFKPKMIGPVPPPAATTAKAVTETAEAAAKPSFGSRLKTGAMWSVGLAGATAVGSKLMGSGEPQMDPQRMTSAQPGMNPQQIRPY